MASPSPLAGYLRVMLPADRGQIGFLPGLPCCLRVMLATAVGPRCMKSEALMARTEGQWGRLRREPLLTVGGSSLEPFSRVACKLH